MATLSNSQVSSARSDLLRLHNQFRKNRNGKTMLQLDSGLNSGAQQYANWMAANRQYGHSSDLKPSWFNEHCNYVYKNYRNSNGSHCGENVARDYSTTPSVNRAWRESCGHYYNIVDGMNVAMGVGVQRDSSNRYYWCVRFAGKGNVSLCKSACPGGCSSHSFYSNDIWKCPGNRCP